MAEELMQSVLERLTAEGRAPAMSEILTQLGDSDPRLGLMAKYFAQREALAAEEEPEEIEPSPARRGAIDKLHRLVERMYGELEALRERNDSLATAFGACHICWGEDPVCEACGGDGVPGSSAPDKVLFAHYVGPVIQILRPRPPRTKAAPPSAPEPPHFQPETDNHNNTNNHNYKGDQI
jgi:hypothetical protein